MKKLLVVILLIAMLASATAMAEVIATNDFSIELPAGYEPAYNDQPDYHVYQESTFSSYPYIHVIPAEYIYSLDEVVETYSAEIENINGIDFARWDDYDRLDAIFLAGSRFYHISYETLGSYDDTDTSIFENMLQSVVITADTSIDEELAAAAEAYPILEKGSKGDDVKALQQRLIDLLYLSGNADGDYGNKTKAAVEEFQKAAGILPVTGIADGITQAKLFADDAPEAELSISCSVAGINSYSTAYWNVNGQEFTLKNGQTKTLTTPWGTYKFDAYGNYEKIE